VLAVAILGRIAGGFVPPAPPVADGGANAQGKVDWNILRASIRLVSATLHVRRLFLAIVAISFFWSMGAVLAAQFPPLVKNSLGSDQTVATLFLAVFSVGVAVGSVLVNLLLKGQVSARYSPAAALGMGVFVLDLFRRVRYWPAHPGGLHDIGTFLTVPNSWMVIVDLLGVAIAGGMFVVPLYAFLTTTVPKSETARTIAANNIVNSGFMVAATMILTLAVMSGVTVADSLLIVAIASVIAAWLGWKLHQACD
jgi:MFS family permease